MSVSGISTANGETVQTASYSAFGNLLNQSTTNTNTLKYTGREIDPETGLYYYRARYYDSNSGRFISEDPLGFQAGINFYAYVRNNPVNANDPTGMRDLTPGEQTLLQPIFGQSNQTFYSSIDVKQGAGGNPIAAWALNVMGRPAITLGNTIHVATGYYQSDFSAGAVSINDQALLAHETTHVWQNQQNGFVSTAVGSIVDNVTKGNNAYYYR